MKPIIRDFYELSDSREILEAKPKPIVPLFLTILLAIIVGLLIWSYYGEMDVVAKSQGVVRPNDKISVIQSKVLGKVEKVHFRKGEYVKKGSVLFTLEEQDLKTQFEMVSSQLKNKSEELSNTQKLKESIISGQNLFSMNVKQEVSYYEEYLKYSNDFNALKADLANQSIQIDKSQQDISTEKATLESSLITNRKDIDQQKKNKDLSVQLLTNEIKKKNEEAKNLSLLEQSYLQNKNMFQGQSNVYSNKYTSFEFDIDQLEIHYDSAKQKYERSVSLGEEYIPKVQLQEEKKAMELAQWELTNYVESTKNKVKEDLHLINLEINRLEMELHKLSKGPVAESIEDEVNLQKSSLSTKTSVLEKEKSIVKQFGNVTLEKFHTDKLVELNGKINQLKEEIKTIEGQKQEISVAKQDRKIVAPTGGIIEMSTEITSGEVFQPGQEILKIIPNEQTRYKVLVSVPNREINRVKVGDTINYHFEALPYKEFGTVSGEVTKISSDSLINNEAGASFYTVEATLENQKLFSYKGKEAKVKVGMTGQAYIVTESKKIMHFILEKINLKE